MLNVLLLSLESLFEQNGVYYQIYNEIKELKDFDKRSSTAVQLEASELLRVILFFKDDKINEMAEELEVETRLKMYDCLLPFKKSAKNLFFQFNGR